ncbi:hypothetical protein [Actinophytocola sp.]
MRKKTPQQGARARHDILPSSDVVPHSVDPKSAQRLWELSEHLLEA